MFRSAPTDLVVTVADEDDGGDEGEDDAWAEFDRAALEARHGRPG